MGEEENVVLLTSDSEEDETNLNISGLDLGQSKSKAGEEEGFVLVSSDSEEDESNIWSKKAKDKNFKRLWGKARNIIFHYLSFDKTSSSFPYDKFKDLSDDLKRTLNDTYLESVRDFLWKNVIRWIASMKLSYSGIADLKYDDKFNLIVTNLMVDYINFKCRTYNKSSDENEKEERINEILIQLSIIFSGNVSHIVMTLMGIDVREEYSSIQYHIFNKYLSDKRLHQSEDFISYLRLILCYRNWKKMFPFKEDKEKINVIAVGKSPKILKGEAVDGTEVEEEEEGASHDGVLPKQVPAINDNNRMFTAVSDLVNFAKNKRLGTRNLLIKKTLDLDEAVEKFYKLYDLYINQCAEPVYKSQKDIVTIDCDEVKDTVNFRTKHQSTTTPMDEVNLARKNAVSKSTTARTSETIHTKNIPTGQKGTALNQHLANACDINNLRTKTSIKKQIVENSCKSNNFKSNSNKHDRSEVYEIDSTDEEDNINKNEKQTGPVPYTNQTKQGKTNIGGISKFRRKPIDTVVLSSSEDETEVGQGKKVGSDRVSAVRHIQPVSRPVSVPCKTVRTDSSGSRRNSSTHIRKEIQKCIPGEVSSTTSVDTNDVASSNEREVGSGTVQIISPPSTEYTKFMQLLEEAILISYFSPDSTAKKDLLSKVGDKTETVSEKGSVSVEKTHDTDMLDTQVVVDESAKVAPVEFLTLDKSVQMPSNKDIRTIESSVIEPEKIDPKRVNLNASIVVPIEFAALATTVASAIEPKKSEKDVPNSDITLDEITSFGESLEPIKITEEEPMSLTEERSIDGIKSVEESIVSLQAEIMNQTTCLLSENKYNNEIKQIEVRVDEVISNESESILLKKNPEIDVQNVMPNESDSSGLVKAVPLSVQQSGIGDVVDNDPVSTESSLSINSEIVKDKDTDKTVSEKNKQDDDLIKETILTTANESSCESSVLTEDTVNDAEETLLTKSEEPKGDESDQVKDVGMEGKSTEVETLPIISLEEAVTSKDTNEVECANAESESASNDECTITTSNDKTEQITVDSKAKVLEELPLIGSLVDFDTKVLKETIPENPLIESVSPQTTKYANKESESSAPNGEVTITTCNDIIDNNIIDITVVSEAKVLEELPSNIKDNIETEYNVITKANSIENLSNVELAPMTTEKRLNDDVLDDEMDNAGLLKEIDNQQIEESVTSNDKPENCSAKLSEIECSTDVVEVEPNTKNQEEIVQTIDTIAESCSSELSETECSTDVVEVEQNTKDQEELVQTIDTNAESRVESALPEVNDDRNNEVVTEEQKAITTIEEKSITSIEEKSIKPIEEKSITPVDEAMKEEEQKSITPNEETNMREEEEEKCITPIDEVNMSKEEKTPTTQQVDEENMRKENGEPQSCISSEVLKIFSNEKVTFHEDTSIVDSSPADHMNKCAYSPVKIPQFKTNTTTLVKGTSKCDLDIKNSFSQRHPSNESLRLKRRTSECVISNSNEMYAEQHMTLRSVSDNSLLSYNVERNEAALLLAEAFHLPQKTNSDQVCGRRKKPKMVKKLSSDNETIEAARALVELKGKPIFNTEQSNVKTTITTRKSKQPTTLCERPRMQRRTRSSISQVVKDQNELIILNPYVPKPILKTTSTYEPGCNEKSQTKSKKRISFKLDEDKVGNDQTSLGKYTNNEKLLDRPMRSMRSRSSSPQNPSSESDDADKLVIDLNQRVPAKRSRTKYAQSKSLNTTISELLMKAKMRSTALSPPAISYEKGMEIVKINTETKRQCKKPITVKHIEQRPRNAELNITPKDPSPDMQNTSFSESRGRQRNRSQTRKETNVQAATKETNLVNSENEDKEAILSAVDLIKSSTNPDHGNSIVEKELIQNAVACDTLLEEVKRKPRGRPAKKKRTSTSKNEKLRKETTFQKVEECADKTEECKNKIEESASKIEECLSKTKETAHGNLDKTYIPSDICEAVKESIRHEDRIEEVAVNRTVEFTVGKVLTVAEKKQGRFEHTYNIDLSNKNKCEKENPVQTRKSKNFLRTASPKTTIENKSIQIEIQPVAQPTVEEIPKEITKVDKTANTKVVLENNMGKEETTEVTSTIIDEIIKNTTAKSRIRKPSRKGRKRRGKQRRTKKDVSNLVDSTKVEEAMVTDSNQVKQDSKISHGDTIMLPGKGLSDISVENSISDIEKKQSIEIENIDDNKSIPKMDSNETSIVDKQLDCIEPLDNIPESSTQKSECHVIETLSVSNDKGAQLSKETIISKDQLENQEHLLVKADKAAVEHIEKPEMISLADKTFMESSVEINTNATIEIEGPSMVTLSVSTDKEAQLSKETIKSKDQLENQEHLLVKADKAAVEHIEKPKMISLADKTSMESSVEIQTNAAIEIDGPSNDQFETLSALKDCVEISLKSSIKDGCNDKLVSTDPESLSSDDKVEEKTEEMILSAAKEMENSLIGDGAEQILTSNDKLVEEHNEDIEPEGSAATKTLRELIQSSSVSKSESEFLKSKEKIEVIPSTDSISIKQLDLTETAEVTEDILLKVSSEPETQPEIQSELNTNLKSNSKEALVAETIAEVTEEVTLKVSSEPETQPQIKSESNANLKSNSKEALIMETIAEVTEDVTLKVSSEPETQPEIKSDSNTNLKSNSKEALITDTIAEVTADITLKVSSEPETQPEIKSDSNANLKYSKEVLIMETIAEVTKDVTLKVSSEPETQPEIKSDSNTNLKSNSKEALITDTIAEVTEDITLKASTEPETQPEIKLDSNTNLKSNSKEALIPTDILKSDLKSKLISSDFESEGISTVTKELPETEGTTNEDIDEKLSSEPAVQFENNSARNSTMSDATKPTPKDKLKELVRIDEPQANEYKTAEKPYKPDILTEFDQNKSKIIADNSRSTTTKAVPFSKVVPETLFASENDNSNNSGEFKMFPQILVASTPKKRPAVDMAADLSSPPPHVKKVQVRVKRLKAIDQMLVKKTPEIPKDFIVDVEKVPNSHDAVSQLDVLQLANDTHMKLTQLNQMNPLSNLEGSGDIDLFGTPLKSGAEDSAADSSITTFGYGVVDPFGMSDPLIHPDDVTADSEWPDVLDCAHYNVGGGSKKGPIVVSHDNMTELVVIQPDAFVQAGGIASGLQQGVALNVILDTNGDSKKGDFMICGGVASEVVCPLVDDDMTESFGQPIALHSGISMNVILENADTKKGDFMICGGVASEVVDNNITELVDKSVIAPKSHHRAQVDESKANRDDHLFGSLNPLDLNDCVFVASTEVGFDLDNQNNYCDFVWDLLETDDLSSYFPARKQTTVCSTTLPAESSVVVDTVKTSTPKGKPLPSNSFIENILSVEQKSTNFRISDKDLREASTSKACVVETSKHSDLSTPEKCKTSLPVLRTITLPTTFTLSEASKPKSPVTPNSKTKHPVAWWKNKSPNNSENLRKRSLSNDQSNTILPSTVKKITFENDADIETAASINQTSTELPPKSLSTVNKITFENYADLESVASTNQTSTELPPKSFFHMPEIDVPVKMVDVKPKERDEQIQEPARKKSKINDVIKENTVDSVHVRTPEPPKKMTKLDQPADDVIKENTVDSVQVRTTENDKVPEPPKKKPKIDQPAPTPPIMDLFDKLKNEPPTNKIKYKTESILPKRTEDASKKSTCDSSKISTELTTKSALVDSQKQHAETKVLTIPDVIQKTNTNKGLKKPKPIHPNAIHLTKVQSSPIMNFKSPSVEIPAKPKHVVETQAPPKVPSVSTPKTQTSKIVNQPIRRLSTFDFRSHTESLNGIRTPPTRPIVNFKSPSAEIAAKPTRQVPTKMPSLALANPVTSKPGISHMRRSSTYDVRNPTESFNGIAPPPIPIMNLKSPSVEIPAKMATKPAMNLSKALTSKISNQPLRRMSTFDFRNPTESFKGSRQVPPMKEIQVSKPKSSYTQNIQDVPIVQGKTFVKTTQHNSSNKIRIKPELDYLPDAKKYRLETKYPGSTKSLGHQRFDTYPAPQPVHSPLTLGEEYEESLRAINARFEPRAMPVLVHSIFDPGSPRPISKPSKSRYEPKSVPHNRCEPKPSSQQSRNTLTKHSTAMAALKNYRIPTTTATQSKYTPKAYQSVLPTSSSASAATPSSSRCLHSAVNQFHIKPSSVAENKDRQRQEYFEKQRAAAKQKMRSHLYVPKGGSSLAKPAQQTSTTTSSSNVAGGSGGVPSLTTNTAWEFKPLSDEQLLDIYRARQKKP